MGRPNRVVLGCIGCTRMQAYYAWLVAVDLAPQSVVYRCYCGLDPASSAAIQLMPAGAHSLG